MSTIKLPLYEYCNDAWVAVDLGVCASAPESQFDTLTFLTYNIWFEKHEFENRGTALRKIICESNADVICLQECTDPFLFPLLRESCVRGKYRTSDVYGRTYSHQYGTVILVKKELCVTEFCKIPFESMMGRYALLVNFAVNSSAGAKETMGVCTSHFESLDNARIRKMQLENVFQHIGDRASCTHAMVMGDFNFDPSWAREQATLNTRPEFRDMWLEACPGAKDVEKARTLRKEVDWLFENQDFECAITKNEEADAFEKSLPNYPKEIPNMVEIRDQAVAETLYPGFTMPANEQFSPWRPDRMMLRSETYVAASIVRVGREDIGAGCKKCPTKLGHPCTPSDHFGLLGVVQLRGTGPAGEASSIAGKARD